MGAYLIDNPPAVSQFSRRTNWTPSTPTGLTVLHTAESVMDTVGPDTGAEAVANFIRTRTTYGSYHDLCDSDSVMHLVPYEYGAYQDGTGTNGCALSISFACATTDWNKMSAAKRRAFLVQGAKAFAMQQAWLRANGYPTTPLRLVTKAASDARMPGFIYHGWRDPARRSDPGINPPNLFPMAEFVELCAAAVAGQLDEEDIMATKEELRELLREEIPAALIAPSPVEKIGGDKPRSLQAMIGRLLDDASAASQKGSLILAALHEGLDFDLSDEDVQGIIAGLATSIPDALERMSDEDVQRIAERSADVAAARLAAGKPGA